MTAATWELTLLIGAIAVVAFTLVGLLMSFIVGGSFSAGVKKALGTLLRNLP